MSTSPQRALDALLPLVALLEPLVNPLVAKVVEETLAQREADEAKLSDGRLWYSEYESAAMCGLPAHRLRDCRRRGEITGSKIGKTIGYERDELLRFLRAQRIET